MKSTERSNQNKVRRKVYHCDNCGRIQSVSNYTCEGCGTDLGLYGTVKFIYEEVETIIEDRPSKEELRRQEKKRQEEERRLAEEERKRLAEVERKEKLRQQEEARKRAEEEKRLAEERKRQEQLRQQEEARKRAEEEKRLAEEQKRKEQLRQQEEARKRAEEEKRLAEEQKRKEQLRQQEEARKRAEEEKRLAEEQKRKEQLRQQEEARKRAEDAKRLEEQERLKQQRLKERREKEALRRKQAEERKKPQEKKESEGDPVAKVASTIFMTICSIVGIGAVLVVLLMIIGLNSRRCGDDLTWSFDEDTGTLTIQGTGQMDLFSFAEDSGRDDIFPEDMEEAPWMRHYREEIRHVVIEEGAVNIGDCAFTDCVNLEDVVMPESVERIGQFAFCNTALVNVTIPASVEKIENCAFADDSNLRNFFFAGLTPTIVDYIFGERDERLVIIGNDAHARAYAEEYGIPFVWGSDVSESGDFGGDSDDGNLNWSINLYDRTMTLTGSGPMEDFNGRWMLDNEENMEAWVEGRNFPYWTDYAQIIEKLVLEDGITRIGDSAFERCLNMKKVTLPSTLEYIGFQSFLSAGITRIEIPEGVTEIRDHAFNFCESLVVAILPESLEKLQNGTFNMCNDLNRLTIGENTVVEERTGTNGCYSVFSNDDNPTGRPKNLTIFGKLGSSAYRFALEENFAFAETGLKTGLVEDGKCGDNVRWKFVGDERTLYIEGYGDTWSYHITQEDIDSWAQDLHRRKQTREEDAEFLTYARYIDHIVVKKGVNRLGHNLFSWHDNPRLVNLQTVDFGNVKHIQANLKNTMLKYVELPDSVTGIDGCALADNYYLKTVVIRNGSEWLGNGLLYNCSNLTRVELYGKEVFEAYNGGDIFNSPGDLPEWTPSNKLRLYVTHGSVGESCAKENKIPYSYLE